LDWILIFQLIILLALVGITANLMSKGTEELERILGRGMTGGVILGVIYALPETIMAIQAVLNGIYNFAIGSALGGNILLFTLGLGFISIFYYIKYRSKIIRLDKDISIEYNSLLIATIILAIAIMYGKLDFFLSFLLIVPYAYYIYKRYSYFADGNVKKEKGSFKRSLTYLLVGGVSLIFLSKYFIITVVSVAKDLNMPLLLISILLTPIAAELEENLTAIKLVYDSPSDVTTAVMNFMGSKLENMTLLLSIIGLWQSISLRSSLVYLLLILVITTITLEILRDRNIKINEGIALLGIYVISITVLLRLSA